MIIITNKTKFDIILQLLLRLLDAWSSGSSLKHTPYEQQVYITKAIIICVAFLKQEQAQQMHSGMDRF